MNTSGSNNYIDRDVGVDSKESTKLTIEEQEVKPQIRDHCREKGNRYFK